MSKRRVVKNTVYAALSQGISLLVSLVALPFFLKSYGVSIYGLFLLVSSVAAALAVFDGGVTPVITKEVARCKAINDSDALRVHLHTSFVWSTALAFTVSMLLFLAGLFAKGLFRVNTEQAELLRLMFFVQAAVQFFTCVCAPARPVLAGFQRYGVIAICTVGTAIGSAAATVTVLLTGRGPLVLVLLNGVVSVLANVALLIAAAYTFPRGILKRRENSRRQPLFPALKTLLRLGFPLFIVQVTGFLLQQQSDKIVLGVALSAAALSLFEIGSKLASLARQAIDMAATAVLPHVSDLHARGKHQQVNNTFLFGSRYLTLLLSPLLTLLFVAAPRIVTLWCGERFIIAATIARLLLASSIFWPMLELGDAVLISSDQMRRWAPWALVSGILNLVLAIILAHPFGSVGVAVASCLGGFVSLAFYMRVIFTTTTVRPGDWLRKVVVPGSASIIGAIALGTAFSLFWPASSLTGLAWHLAFLAFCAYVLVWFVILSPAERAMIRAWLHPNHNSKQ